MVEISDSNFADSDWVTTEILVNNGATYSAGQVDIGGDFLRSMVHTMTPAVPSDTFVAVVHEFQGAVFNPSTQGAIISADYSERVAVVNPPFPGAEVFWAPVVFQNGSAYAICCSSATNTTLQSVGFTGLIGASFVDLEDVFAGTPRDRPDFTETGDPITFGYYRASSYTTPFGTQLREHVIDDWKFVLTIVPEPSTGVLVGLGTLALGYRRRRFPRRA